MVRKQYAGAAVETSLSSGITNVASSMTVADGSSLPDGSVGPFVLVVGRGTANEEKVLATARSGNSITGMTRGYDGTSGVTHNGGEAVEHVLDAVTLDEANAHVNDDTRDDHSQYLSEARHDVNADRHDSLPWGYLDHAVKTTTQIGIDNTVTAVSGLSVTATVGTGRVIKVTAKLTVSASDTGSEIIMSIVEGDPGVAANYRQQVHSTPRSGGAWDHLMTEVILTPSAGAHTYDLYLQRSTGTGTVAVQEGATWPGFLLVEDIGPA